MTTAGRWPWKPASAKECVTAHQPNGDALKMDVVKLAVPYRAGSQIQRNRMPGRPMGAPTLVGVNE